MLPFKELLHSKLQCAVEYAEWRLGEFVVPQLRVTSPACFLLQINDDASVCVEMSELTALDEHPVTPTQRAELLSSTALIEIGEPEPVERSELGVLVYAGFTHFDPGEGRRERCCAS